MLRAAQAAGAHDMILRLPPATTPCIGDGGEGMSIGQRQRIALARALYGEPFLVLLDEPSANLDGEGEAALQKAISELKARGAIVILIVHRRPRLPLCDKVLVLHQWRAAGASGRATRSCAGSLRRQPAAGA